jgi:hypothetical protein
MAYKRALNSFIRHAAKVEAYNAKQRQIQQNIKSVEEYNSYINTITSYHKKVNSIAGWHNHLIISDVQEPTNLHTNEDRAKAKLESFNPNFLIRFLGLSSFFENRLKDSVQAGNHKDTQAYNNALRKYQTLTKQIETNRRFLEGIKEKSQEIYTEILQEKIPFQNIGMCNGVNMEIFSNCISADCKVADQDSVIPKNVLSNTQTGKLSIKDMPITKSHKLYQEYVCSCLIRTAREFFCLLPIEYVSVNAIVSGHNPQTGQDEDQPILSTLISREQYNKIIFENIDPVSCIEGLNFKMNFKRSEGFYKIERIALPIES